VKVRPPLWAKPSIEALSGTSNRRCTKSPKEEGDRTLGRRARKKTQRAILLDRDGVINFNRDDYVKSVSEFRFLPSALDAVARLAQLELPMAIISNQQGIGKGLIRLPTLKEINDLIRSEFAQREAQLVGIYYCPHLESDDCGCRKPEIGLFERAAQDHAIDLSASYFIGDSESDACAGVRAGCTTVIVLTGKIRALPKGWRCNPDHVCPDLGEAAEWILRRERGA
jgi:D-glycero-D-manno-heptose 1,7-bisphosphate phosphatase